jgi:AcrR family transcriptional regulator
MNNKEIQEQRIRGYFIDATREMLKGEGIRSINVRAVADRAGYSYATLYNYFKDIKELVFICVKDFQEEAEAIIKEKAAAAPHGKEKIRAIMKSYISYFVQYPGIFELFFVEKMNDLGANQPTASLIYSFPDRLCDNEWQYCVVQNILTEEKAGILKNELRFLVTGMMLFYMHRGQPASYDEFIMMADNQLNHVLDF